MVVNREIDSKYDAVLEVRDKLPEIEQVAGMDIDAILAALEAGQDFTGITVVTGPVTSWDAENKVLTVATVKGDTGEQGVQGIQGVQGPMGPVGPRGLAGVNGVNGSNGLNGAAGINGLNGMVPIIEFSIDTNGDLIYEVIGYEEGPVAGDRFPTQEW
jgi:hypothetical protein